MFIPASHSCDYRYCFLTYLLFYKNWIRSEFAVFIIKVSICSSVTVWPLETETIYNFSQRHQKAWIRYVYLNPCKKSLCRNRDTLITRILLATKLKTYNVIKPYGELCSLILYHEFGINTFNHNMKL